MKRSQYILLLCLIHLCATVSAFGQMEYFIHDRGMLNQSVFNAGSIGYAAPQPADHSPEAPYYQPAGEWPPYSYFVTADREYTGSHCMMGGGIQIQGIPGDSVVNAPEEILALCTGYYDVSAHQSYLSTTIGHSAPISFTKTNNFPVLEDGSLNPSYDPDEAEQKIVAVFATKNGFTVTRTSRQWSYPDYDDFIIYEYELVFTGNTDSDPATIEMADSSLKDCIVAFTLIMAPSRLGFDRNYGNWDVSVYSQAPIHGSYQDHDYWLTYSQNVRTGSNYNAAGMPEPDPAVFLDWSKTGKHGGGLLSHQAYGMAVLYYENHHRAIVTPDYNTTESQLWWWYLPRFHSAFDSIGENQYLKRQPFQLHGSYGYETPKNMWIIDPRQGRGGPFFGTENEDWNPHAGYPPDTLNWSEEYKDKWKGRNFLMEKRWAAGWPQHHLQFGPYRVYKGDTLNFTIAEVVGFGSQDRKVIFGGERDRSASIYWNQVQGWNRRIETKNGALLTENYVEEFGYPDHVNSDVVDIQQVTHKAFEAYTGADSSSLVVPVWPEDNPPKGVYRNIKIPFPAPGIHTANTDQADVKITWNTQAEDVSGIIPQDRLLGSLAAYHVYRSEDRVAWDLIATVDKGDVNPEGNYEVTDGDVKVGDLFYYSVTSVDAEGHESGKTNIRQHDVKLGSPETLTQVYVVPNPFYVESHFAGAPGNKIGFYNLPAPCTIRIFSTAGQLIETIEHTTNSYEHEYLQITRSDQRLASGVYFYVVTTPEGETARGKFIIIR